MRSYILTKEEKARVEAYLAGGPYEKITRNVLSRWRADYKVLLQDIRLLKELEAKRR